MSRESELEKKIEYEFKDKSLLVMALQHSSYVNERGMDKVTSNERLEFLGDAVLQLVITDTLYATLPNYTEGYMTKLRSDIVRESSLRECAEYIDLGDYLYLGKGEENTGGRTKSSLLADSFEALVGALYLDGGYLVAQRLVDALFEEKIERSVKDGFKLDYKTQLQEVVQRHGEVSLGYKVDHADGPDHDRTFYVDVYLNKKKIGSGIGKNKKEAEQDAAKNALDKGDLDVL